MSHIIVPISRGLVTLVSPEDEHLAMSRRWCANPRDSKFGGFYATCSQDRTTIYLHREIMKAAAGQLVDHINGDGLDNRRCNLRLADHRLNLANRGFYTPKSGFRGVYPERVGKKWIARISIDSRFVRLGSFVDPVDAAHAYDSAAREHFGEFASTNFPLEAR